MRRIKLAYEYSLILFLDKKNNPRDEGKTKAPFFLRQKSIIVFPSPPYGADVGKEGKKSVSTYYTKRETGKAV